jgi:ABC-type transporter Mla subunit MlaD
VAESRSRKSNKEVTVNNAESIIERLDKLEVKQSELEQNTKAANATKQLIKKTVDNLEKQINDKIKTLHNVLAELEEKLNKGHGALEGSMQNIETSTKKKFEEIRKVLKENGETAEEKHVFILDSLDKLNSAVNSDLKTKVADFDMHITSIRTSKDEADKLLEELQTVVEKIRPNTFNKGKNLSL